LQFDMNADTKAQSTLLTQQSLPVAFNWKAIDKNQRRYEPVIQNAALQHDNQTV